MWPVLVVVSIAVCAWAWWLAGEPRAPRWARWSAPVVAATAIAIGAYARWAIEHTWDAASNANASARQEELRSGLASAYTALAIGWAIAAIAIAAITGVTLRRREPA